MGRSVSFSNKHLDSSQILIDAAPAATTAAASAVSARDAASVTAKAANTSIPAPAPAAAPAPAPAPAAGVGVLSLPTVSRVVRGGGDKFTQSDMGGGGLGGLEEGGFDDDSYSDSESSSSGEHGEREKARNLKLPRFVFTEDVQGADFFRAVDSHTQSEASLALSMRSLRVDTEIRQYSESPPTLTLFKRVSESPPWIWSDPFRALEKTRLSSRITRDKLRKEADSAGGDVEFTSVKSQEYELIKSGKFGPDVEEFTMPLPEMYPSRAGQSRYALRPALEEHEK
ncbi:hypothetical protein B484DRAFT_391922, partial [Ochromonadaceae sp. CCMP2298]